MLGKGPMLDRLIAHVDYVTDPEPSPDPIRFLLDALALPGAMLLIAVGVAGGARLPAGLDAMAAA